MFFPLWNMHVYLYVYVVVPSFWNVWNVNELTYWYVFLFINTWGLLSSHVHVNAILKKEAISQAHVMSSMTWIAFTKILYSDFKKWANKIGSGFNGLLLLWILHSTFLKALENTTFFLSILCSNSKMKKRGGARSISWKTDILGKISSCTP